jgi:hypothetical protein
LGPSFLFSSFFFLPSVKPSEKSEIKDQKTKKKKKGMSASSSSSSAGKRKGDELENDREQKRFRNDEDKEGTIQLTLALLKSHADSISALTRASDGDVVHVPALIEPLFAGGTPNASDDEVSIEDYLRWFRIDGIDWTIKDPKTNIVQFEASCYRSVFHLEKAIEKLRVFILFAMENYMPDTDSTHNVFLRTFEIAEGIGRALAPLQGISVSSADDKMVKIQEALSRCAREIPRSLGKVALIPRLPSALKALEMPREKTFGYSFSNVWRELVLRDSKDTDVLDFSFCNKRAVDISVLNGEDSLTVVLRFFGREVRLKNYADNTFCQVNCCVITLSEGNCKIAHDA